MRMRWVHVARSVFRESGKTNGGERLSRDDPETGAFYRTVPRKNVDDLAMGMWRGV